ncbi:hypothetical protein [Methylobacterium sp. WL9]|uniref:hypothetical protein n=1 Tax=Methylobacterium sp. WL9 TaxID=2603898 RepID=UPI0011C8FE71|nr:hypothetical protein [Methylobacterium sp. WL9]TXN25062.1 hypothetical protein FV217_00535 [Methylobacterium sp. WL9]
MKTSLLAYAAALSLALAPVAALAQHIDVGPGGVGVHGDGHHDHHDDHHEVVRDHHHHDDHHDDHGGEHSTTVIERH